MNYTPEELDTLPVTDAEFEAFMRSGKCQLSTDPAGTHGKWHQSADVALTAVMEALFPKDEK
jgi:hypothetical protein